MAGAAGTVVAVIEIVVVAVEVPLALVAVTLNVYEVPPANPVTVKGDAPDTPDAVNEVTVLPPFVADAVIVAAPLLKARPIPTFTADTVGACGTVVAVTAEEADDAAEVPAALVAVTVKLTDADEAIPVTVNGEDEPVAVCPVLAVTV